MSNISCNPLRAPRSRRDKGYHMRFIDRCQIECMLGDFATNTTFLRKRQRREV